MTKKKINLGPTLLNTRKSNDGVLPLDYSPDATFTNGNKPNANPKINGKDPAPYPNGKIHETDARDRKAKIQDADDDDEQSSTCGCFKKGPKDEMVGTFELFQFATGFDQLLILLGSIGAVIAGTCFIGNVTILGEVINIFVKDDENETSSLSSADYNSTAGEQTEYLDELMPYIYAYLIVGIVSIISGFTSVCCWTLSAERQVATMRKRFFQSVMSQTIGWFDVNGSGEISSRFSEDLAKVQEGLGEKTGIFIQWCSTYLAAIIMAFTRSWQLTLFALPFSPITMLFGMIMFRTMRRMAAREAKAYAKAGAIAEQAFRAIRTVQAFQGQEKESARYESHLGAAVKTASRKGLVLGISNSSIWVIVYLLFAGVMWFGLWLMQNSTLNPGSIIQVFFGVLIGSMSLGQAFNNLESLSNARGAAVKIFNIINQKSPIDAFSEDGHQPSTLDGRVEFCQVAFRYPARPDVTVAKNLSFKIKPGEHVALVGPSGCGKSTAIQLLQRFYDPLAGKKFYSVEREPSVMYDQRCLAVCLMGVLAFATPVFVEGSGVSSTDDIHYVVEVLAVIDTSMQEAWINKPGVGSQEKLLTEIESFFKEVNFIYHSLRKYNLSLEIRLLDVVFPTDPIVPESALMEGNKVWERQVGSFFNRWLAKYQYTYDHAMIFTNYNMKGSYLVNGVASMAAICRTKGFTGTSRVKGRMDYSTVITAAHELGHSLGAGHDSKKREDCYNGHIMSPSQWTASRNRFYFSSCSAEAIKRHIQKRLNKNNNCLLDTTSLPIVAKRFGEIVDQHTLCKRKGGWVYAKRGSGDTLCQVLRCAKTGSITNYTTPEGIGCGDGRQCYMGYCV
ncbi:multidrug resistance protein 1 [Plakobranchus ocellatus]|uniref:Multidrug resistance protein 1 n=1 Tax=Plakobranchus ocellatus TaxID=259542 RepID=A0AAV4CXH5_9GAST|nr:multidrug resistance protein 1 [Plakobranchus ocellatus]